MCLACRRQPGPICGLCRRDLRPVSPTIISGAPVYSAFVHGGAAAALVHRLKYEGVDAVAALLAVAMAPLVPSGAACLVPVPRASVRLWRHGVDGGGALAHRVGALVGLPVMTALRRPIWHPPHAGKRREARRQRTFAPAVMGLVGAVIVDDVLTTGATVGAAIDAVGDVIAGVTATRSTGTSLFLRASS